MSHALLYYFLVPLTKAVVAFLVVALVAGVLTLLERRILALLQVRKGPNRVGWQGSIQWLADVVKLLMKEDTVPKDAEGFVHLLAPILVMAPALTVFGILPWGPEFTVTLPWVGTVTTPIHGAADVNVGLLLLLAVTTVGIYGIILGGWASNSKYALLGGLRSAAQLISYEVPMGFAVVAVILMANTLSLTGIIAAQKEAGLWFIFPGLVAFFCYFLSGVAETNRTPFDLPEAESELVAGFHTEYSGFRWAIFFLSEYANMIVVSTVAVTLFFGGWLPPFPNVSFLSFLSVVPPMVWICLKVAVFMFVYIWFRGTFPRYRFDQLMALGWKVLIPVSLGNLVLVGLAALWGPAGLKVLGLVLTVLFAGAFVWAIRRQAAPRLTTRMGAPPAGVPPRKAAEVSA